MGVGVGAGGMLRGVSAKEDWVFSSDCLYPLPLARRRIFGCGLIIRHNYTGLAAGGVGVRRGRGACMVSPYLSHSLRVREAKKYVFVRPKLFMNTNLVH